MSRKMFPVGSHARLLDGSEVYILNVCKDNRTYHVQILTGPSISIVRGGRLLHVRDIVVPEENVEPLIPPPHLAWKDALFAAPAWRRC